jgi:3-phenylpropionate/trans-cinnamate dioxygenase ferredoxin reductase component
VWLENIMNDGVVIIGAGQAAAQLAMSLRQGGFTGPVMMIGDEQYPPYQRPPLSKRFLSEPQAAHALDLRPASFWREQDVTLHLSARVGAVDVKRRRVALADGREIEYGSLVFATGALARTLALPGIDRAGVFSLRRIDDVLRLRPALDQAKRVVIVGGGYIGLEVAAVVRTEGRSVTVVEAQERVLKRVTGRSVSAYFDALHRARSVDIRLNAQVAAIEREDGVAAVVLADGERVSADLVLLAAGARANDDLARAAGLACDDGILVDETTRTRHPGVYAAGDCTRFPSGRYARCVRLESVQNAIDQAKAAAAAILGRPYPYDPVPWFWSDQYDLKLQIAGLADGYDAEEMIGEADTPRFSVEYRSQRRLIAVDAVNDARAHMMARRRIAQETADSPVASSST